MPTYIGENEIVDRYLGDKFLEAAYIGDEKVYDPYTEITGYLPMIFKSRAAVALKNYRIYGTTEGAGVQTENLFDVSAYDAGFIPRKTLNDNGEQVDSTGNGYSTYFINIVSESSYTICGNLSSGEYASRIYYYDENDNFLSRSGQITILNLTDKFTFTSPANCKRIRLQSAITATRDEVVLVSGSVAPTTYVPFGYKIPISLQSGETENLFDKKTALIGYLATLTGLQPSDSYGCSDYIPVTEGIYTAVNVIGRNYQYAVVTYNSEKVAQNRLTVSPTGQYVTGQVEIPAGISYVRINFNSQNNNVDTVMLVKGSTPPDHYIPHRYESNYDLFIGDTQLGEEEYLDYGEQKVYKRTENLVNSADSESGYIDANDGLVRPSSVTKTTDYIEIDTSEDYSALLTRVGAIQSTSSRVIAYYAENKTFISYYYYAFSTDANQVTFTLQNTPNNAKYVRFSYDVAFEQITFVSGSTAPDHYIPYGVEPTDPPAPLPTINTYQGENTLSSSETVGEVTIKGRIKEPDPLPEMTGIKAVFEYGGLSGTTWKNKVGANNFIWTSGNEPTDNGTEYVLSGNTFAKAGQYESNDDYSGAVTMYLLAKFEEVKNGAAITIGGLESGYTYGVEIYGSNTYGDFATVSRDAYDMINPAVPANEYHVIAVSAASSDSCITVYGDGIKQLRTTPRTRLPRNYNGKATLYGKLPSSGSGGNMHVKFVAFGNEKHTEEQIIANSQFIMNKYGIS